MEVILDIETMGFAKILVPLGISTLANLELCSSKEEDEEHI